MIKIFKFLLLFVALGFIWTNSFSFDLTEIFNDKQYKHAKAHACGDLNRIGIIYCFDESNPNYMTIPLYENPNEKKIFIRIKDKGDGLSILVFEDQVNKSQEGLSKVRIINKGYDGWIDTGLIQFD